jgi:hypothetical protein
LAALGVPSAGNGGVGHPPAADRTLLSTHARLAVFVREQKRAGPE